MSECHRSVQNYNHIMSLAVGKDPWYQKNQHTDLSMLYETQELIQQVNNYTAIYYMSQDTGQTKSHTSGRHHITPERPTI